MTLLRTSLLIVASICCGLSACRDKEIVEEFEGRGILSVEVRHKGAKYIDEGRIKSYIRSKAGDKFASATVEASIDALYESGLVDDVRFVVEPEGESVRLIAETNNLPLVSPYRGVIGNSAYSGRKLGHESGIFKVRPISLKAMDEACEKMRAFYVSEGYENAKVTCRSVDGEEPTPEGFAFVVDEGAKTK